MSKALDYLLKTRPELMGHYFEFLKHAGDHLDPKTKALISVITKVDAQTEKGFRQYLGRALRDGASANEVLDALFMAFPSLGLTKIIWAVEQIQSMELAEFDVQTMMKKTEWHHLIELDALPGSGSVAVESGDRIFFVYKNGDEIHVYDNHCPHKLTSMPTTALEGDSLTCCRHQWQFDMASGQCISGGDLPLQEMPARLIAGTLEVQY